MIQMHFSFVSETDTPPETDSILDIAFLFISYPRYKIMMVDLGFGISK